VFRFDIPEHGFESISQAFFDAHPQFAERFPGGIAQFAQFAGQLPEEVLEDMMIAEVGGAGGDGRDMPGGLPGDEGVYADFTDEEDAGEVEVPAIARPQSGRREDARDMPQAEEIDEDEDEDGDEEEEEQNIAVSLHFPEQIPQVTFCHSQPLPLRMLRNVLNRFWGTAQEESSDEDGTVDRPHIDDGGVD
jgi:hypothetical protein